MTMYEYKTGDAVRLKAGGPTMTVDYKTKNGTYICKWYDGQELKESEFGPELMQAIGRGSRKSTT